MDAARSSATRGERFSCAGSRRPVPGWIRPDDASVAGYRGPSGCLVSARRSDRAAPSTAYITTHIYFELHRPNPDRRGTHAQARARALLLAGGL